ncbi:hypothetical protein WAX74_05830, partial [Psychrobacillus sp. FJAT-51614]
NVDYQLPGEKIRDGGNRIGMVLTYPVFTIPASGSAVAKEKTSGINLSTFFTEDHFSWKNDPLS